MKPWQHPPINVAFTAAAPAAAAAAAAAAGATAAAAVAMFVVVVVADRAGKNTLHLQYQVCSISKPHRHLG